MILRNHGKSNYEFNAGDRIAQLIVERIQKVKQSSSTTLKKQSMVRKALT